MSNADRDGPAFEGMTFYFDKPKLYAHPDPRIAALETLLQDILSEAQFPGSLVSMSNVMKERIEAALGKEGS